MNYKQFSKSFFTLFALLVGSAYAGSDNAMHQYRSGNYSEAFQGLQQLSANNKVAMFYLGMMYVNGYGKPKNLEKGVGLISKSAKNNYLPAQMFMGKYYLEKKDNPNEAFSWFKKAAEQGNVNAQMFCAAAYLYGYGTKRNPDKARRYIIMASKKGNAIAQYALAAHFLASKHRKNRKLGLIWLNKSVKQGNAQALYKLGDLYYHGKHVEKDRQLAYQYLEKSANAHNADAEYLMGKYYQTMQGSTASERATEWYERAAKQGNTGAQLELGLLYLHSSLSPEVRKKGVAWIQKAADQGNHAAEKKLVEIYEKGIGVAQDESVAAKWKARSELKRNKKARSGSPKKLAFQWLSGGQPDRDVMRQYHIAGVSWDWKNQAGAQEGSYNLAPKLSKVSKESIFNASFDIIQPNAISISKIIVLLGKLDGRDRRKALELPRYQFKQQGDHQTQLKYLYHLASHGDPASQFALGQMYAMGLGVPKNDLEAMKWFIKAAEQKNVKADYTIGLMYLKGEGVARDNTKAMAWLKSAAFKGSAYAQYTLARIYEYGLGESGDAHYIAKDHQYAISMYHLAASGDYPDAQYQLANLYLLALKSKNISVPMQKKLYQKAYRLYEACVKHGMESAKLPLGYFYAASSDHEKQRWAFKVAKKEARQDNHYADFLLGLMYDRGIGAGQDRDEAVDFYEKSAENNNPIAGFILGTYYYMGESVSKNAEKGITLLESAARHDLPFAQYNLAVINYHRKADFVSLLKKAASEHNGDASLLLADYYLLHNGGSSGLEYAANVYRKLAKLGYAKAQLRLGYMYENGIRFHRNFQEAEHWYRQSAMQNRTMAQYLLGNLYLVGKLGTPNITQAAIWYKKAAKRGFEPAMVALGMMAENVQHNYKQAFSWYQKASEHNNEAKFNLALMYYYGKGEKVDRKKAYQLFEQAAKSNFAPAQYGLAHYYLSDDGSRRSNKKAYKFYQQAADHNFPYANYQLGLLSESGVGTSMNHQEAMQHYRRAANQGSAKAKSALSRLNDYASAMSERISNKKPNLLYMKVIDKMNSGHVQLAISLLNKLIQKYPNFTPAKKAQEYLQKPTAENEPSLTPAKVGEAAAKEVASDKATPSAEDKK